MFPLKFSIVAVTGSLRSTRITTAYTMHALLVQVFSEAIGAF